MVVGALLLLWGIAVLAVPRKLFDAPYSTLVYSKEGELLGARIAADGQWRFPPVDSLPDKFVRCITTYEDRRFFHHPGIDPAAIVRAIGENSRAGKVVSGGSTITMQLARIARGNRDRNLWQKLIEAFWAIGIESRHSKDNILEVYASHAPFGGNTVGIETAAWRYFGRGTDALSWAESATLAVLPNSPALIHPGRNRQQLKEKRDGLLGRLHEQGIIDEGELELACLEPLPDAPLPLPDHAPHLTDRFIAGAKGKRTQTTVSAPLQRRVQQTADRYARNYASSNHIHNIAVLVADLETGEVLAYAGNASFAADERHGNGVDVITSERSTGSILKPFLDAGMLSDGLILPHTLVSDTPLNINGFVPQNYNKRFYGAVPASRALERSLNVPLVRMLSMYNTGRFMSLLQCYGMTTLRFSESHYGASLILGGAEGTLWDMAGMYASMGRVLSHHRKYSGRYDPSDIHPLTLTPLGKDKPIESANDRRLTDKPVLSTSALWYTAEAMSALNRPEEEADWQQFRSMKRIAWKTGTSYGGRDGWAIGFTPRYVVGVWVGNASGEGRAGLTGVGHAAPVMFDVFTMLPGGGWFEMPYDGMEKTAVCTLSGHLASDICNTVDSLYIPGAGNRTSVCPYHKLIHLSPDGRSRVNSSCEQVDKIRTEPWFVLPPAQEYYYRSYNADYRSLPPFRADCRQPQARAIDLIYPEHNAVLYLPTGFSGKKEKFVFRATHTDASAPIYWYANDQFLGVTRGDHRIACVVGTGKHYLSLSDDNGNTRRIAFTVK